MRYLSFLCISIVSYSKLGKCALFCCLASLSLLVHSQQTGPETKRSDMTVADNQSFLAPLVKESLLLDVAQTNTTVVVGERGHVLVGNLDQQEQLTQVPVPTTVTLTAVDGFGDTFLAVGHDATILRSTDSGQTWEVVFSSVDLDRPFLDVSFINEQEAFAIGGYGLFMRSSDAGKTWEQVQHFSLLSPDDIEYLESLADDPEFYQEELNYIFPHFNRISRRGDAIYLVGEAGLIARSADYGNSWERYDIDYFGSFFDARELSNGQILAVGLRGNMFLRGDDGQWDRIESCITTSLNSIVEQNDDVFVVGNNGVVLSLDPSQLSSNERAQTNNENCSGHIALSKIDSAISSSITNAFMLDGVLSAVSANGIQPVE
ncbi:WD40/YVTN/BNR-like repeat-containing protein [Ningiella sp. W23]|uniref:WD40/YVTN/BNR-like repeat-containing protein n=1 Tax=Ningiella sp. W23 TaxID=3023715 RepID=UPI0039F5AA92